MPQNTWTLTKTMPYSYVNHTATLLSNGQVLVAGGSGKTPKVALLYDPTADTWTPTGSLINLHPFDPTATLLPNGTVLLVGGGAQPELYDPTTGTWSATAAMTTPRTENAAVLLPNGQVLVAGGLVNGAPSNLVDIYDPNANTWTSVGNMLGSRANHTATLPPNEYLVFLGGYQGTSDVATYELYDYINMQPFSGGQESHLFTVLNMSNHTATYLATGSILAVGGTENPSQALLISGTSSVNASPCPNAHSHHTATLLPNGQVLVAGGGATGSETAAVDIYVPSNDNPSTSGIWSSGPISPMNVPRTNHAGVLLSDGRYLVIGGSGSPQATSVGALRVISAGNTAEYYMP